MIPGDAMSEHVNPSLLTGNAGFIMLKRTWKSNYGEAERQEESEAPGKG
jgi:hypothetical protein